MTSIESCVSKPDRETASALEIAPISTVIVYETAAAARRALALLSRLHALANGEFKFQPILWRFDLLSYENWRRAAAADAAVADVVVLATDVTQQLPLEISRWVEEVFGADGMRPAVVALYGAELHWSVSLRDHERLYAARGSNPSRVYAA